MKTALIFDLDDTIYPTEPVADDMYKDLIALLKSQRSSEVFKSIREDILTTPFQNVADRYVLSKELKDAGMNTVWIWTTKAPCKHLLTINWQKIMQPKSSW